MAQVTLTHFSVSRGNRRLKEIDNRAVGRYFACSRKFYRNRLIVDIIISYLMKPLRTTFSAKPADITNDWYLVDASGKTLGRLASEIAHRLRGKHKTIYTPHMDTGDYVVVVNASKVHVTGNKVKDKIYYRHSGYPGGIKSESFGHLLARKPERIIELAVKRMLPSGPLGRAVFRKLRVFPGDTHDHAAQKPKLLDIGGVCHSEPEPGMESKPI
uniref:Large ribosomal subunit protein uL13 n=1 Tax=Candidatus Kentrum sp. SD TaxID=2126332 RepID=A0A450YHT5_9GAMM|nr:MAG: LSU ribosomal protein L13P [Candidatus Kentron sp. SD]VFK41950.1 MAG: LSU ribosomal protein L13P [Candidatus Kentron sp. SD]VFK78888.1 MAG: LSU ribosomal protein L13P [Candidatus Kentron sp. SD]